MDNDILGQLMNQVRTLDFRDADFPVNFAIVNSPVLIDQLGAAILDKHDEVDVALVWRENADRSVIITLFSRPGQGFDVGDRARRSGGHGTETRGEYDYNRYRCKPVIARMLASDVYPVPLPTQELQDTATARRKAAKAAAQAATPALDVSGQRALPNRRLQQ